MLLLQDLIEDGDVLEVSSVAPSAQGPVVFGIPEDIECGVWQLEAPGGEEIETESIAQSHADDSSV